LEGSRGSDVVDRHRKVPHIGPRNDEGGAQSRAGLPRGARGETSYLGNCCRLVKLARKKWRRKEAQNPDYEEKGRAGQPKPANATKAVDAGDEKERLDSLD